MLITVLKQRILHPACPYGTSLGNYVWLLFPHIP